MIEPRPLGFALDGPPRRIHLLAIGGTGMSAIAEVLSAMGHRISGSDRSPSAVVDRLRALGIDVSVGHDGNVVTSADPPIDALVVSTAIRDDNPELMAARLAGIAVHHRYDVLAALGDVREVISVSGTHGKTTTSALLAAALDGAAMAPGYIIGGDIGGTGVSSGARWTESRWFVLEGDESDSTFLAPRRAGAIVTNIEPDHLDQHGTHERLLAAFGRFVDETQGPVVVCADDPGSMSMSMSLSDGASAARSDARIETYGLVDSADALIADIERNHLGSAWSVTFRGETRRLSVGLPGLHLVRNATAAFVSAVAVGADPVGAVAGIAGYRGVGRRFEPRGDAGGVTFIDDYAHLPAEVDAVLDAVSAGPWNRVVAVLQPHSYSRTAAHAEAFGRSLLAADVGFVTDVYAAREEPVEGVTGRLIVEAAHRAESGSDIRYSASRAELVDALIDELRPGDLCLTMGAGDLTEVPDVVISRIGRS